MAVIFIFSAINFLSAERKKESCGFLLIREFVEVFENSSFTRPSGGAFVWILLKIQKMKKGFVEVILSFRNVWFLMFIWIP